MNIVPISSPAKSQERKAKSVISVEERVANSEQRVCIIGSGPAGCYVAEHLLKLLPDARIDVLEKLPVPFGLIRYGVAPDHQSTKGAARVLDRTLSRDRVRFFGNVEVGRDVSLDELRSMYHIVVLATGAQRDRKLGIPGEDISGVIGSGAFVAWYNGHPSRVTPDLRDVRSAVIIGNGNVALDVTRILAKDAAELKGSDLTPDVLEALSTQPIRDIHIVGRRGAADAKFNEHELEELGTLGRAKPVIEDVNQPSGRNSRTKGPAKVCDRYPHGPAHHHPFPLWADARGFHGRYTPAKRCLSLESGRRGQHPCTARHYLYWI